VFRLLVFYYNRVIQDGLSKLPQSTASEHTTTVNGHLHPLVVYDERHVDMAYLADKFMLICFPPAFLAFNIFYWIHYVT
jgi:hypothetical protein